MTNKENSTGVVHRLPADFRKAIESDPTVKEVWADITPLARNEWICWVTSAKKDETLTKCVKACADPAAGLVVPIVEMTRNCRAYFRLVEWIR
jgi:hypothetical protein